MDETTGRGRRILFTGAAVSASLGALLAGLALVVRSLSGVRLRVDLRKK